MPLWRQVQVPTSIRLSHQLNKDLRTSMFGPRRFHMDSCIHRRHLRSTPSAVDMSRQGTPCPKGPPAEYMPAPPEVTSMSTSASAAVQEPYVTENGKFRKIRSVTDIDWRRPLHEQLEPNLKGGPRSSRTPADLYICFAQRFPS